MTTTPQPHRPNSHEPAVGLITIERVEDIPESFASEAEEAEYWDTHSLDLIRDQLEDVPDNPPWGPNPPRRTPNVRRRPSADEPVTVTIQRATDLVDAVKAFAASRGLSYQSLIHVWIAERLDAEQSASAPGR